MRIGFLGLGQMGYAMALSLLRAGHDVAVWNRTKARMEDMAREAGEAKGRMLIANKPGDAAQGRDVVFTMLTDDVAVESVVFGR